jgi:hypothetical protein
MGQRRLIKSGSINLILSILLLFSILFFINKNDKYIYHIKKLNKEIDSIEATIKYLENENDSLLELKKEKITEYRDRKIYLKLKEDETDSVINSVYDFNERELDSTIRTYKHTERSKS